MEFYLTIAVYHKEKNISTNFKTVIFFIFPHGTKVNFTPCGMVLFRRFIARTLSRAKQILKPFSLKAAHGFSNEICRQIEQY